MRLSADAKPKLEVVLDALASKLGIVSAVGLLFGICFGVALYLQSVVTQLEKDHEVFEDRQVRNGYVAISDMQRLVRVAQQGVNRGGFDARLGREFQEAADILYVRVDHFRSVLKVVRTLLKVSLPSRRCRTSSKWLTLRSRRSFLIQSTWLTGCCGNPPGRGPIW